MNTKLTFRYAKALLDLSVEQNSVEQVFTDITWCKNQLDSSKDLRVFFTSPVINPDKKSKTVAAVFGSHISVLSSKFIDLLISKHRENEFHAICNDFIQQYRSLNKIGELQITSAAPLSETVSNGIVKQVKAAIKMDTMIVEHVIEPELIGGFILNYNNIKYDASLQSALGRIEMSFENNDYIEKI